MQVSPAGCPIDSVHVDATNHMDKTHGGCQTLLRVSCGKQRPESFLTEYLEAFSLVAN